MPLPVKNFLTPEQLSRLQTAIRESELPHVRERILILLLQNDGKTQQEIAKFIGCSPRTVAYWCQHGDPDHLESLHNKREQEHYRKATAEYIKLLLETVDKQPQEMGYEFGRWTGERLATYLAQTTGIQLSGSQVRRILKRKKYSYIWARSRRTEYSARRTRAAKYSLEDKQDSAKRAEFKQKLTKYLAVAQKKPELLQIWFWDETGFSLRVIRRKTWGKKGTRKKVTGKRRRGRVNVIGGIREHDRKRLCFFIKKGDGVTFYEQLQQLNNWVEKEWIEKGNHPEDFTAVPGVMRYSNSN